MSAPLMMFISLQEGRPACNANTNTKLRPCLLLTVRANSSGSGGGLDDLVDGGHCADLVLDGGCESVKSREGHCEKIILQGVVDRAMIHFQRVKKIDSHTSHLTIKTP